MHINTGINRASISYDKAFQATIDVNNSDKFELVGLMSHLVCSEIKNCPIVIEQLKTNSSISGVIQLSGKVPPNKKLILPSGCSTNGDTYSNEILVNQGFIQNVLVRITKGLEGKKFTDIPNTALELDQKGCQYQPRVLAVRVGQKVDFINSDPIFHNIKSVSQNNKSFNVAMPKKDSKVSMTFDHPEIFMQSKCSVHPWMGAYIAVIDHPYFSVTNKNGEFKIENLPPGQYTLEIWHEVFGTQTKDLKISDNENLKIDFTYKEKP
jgi:plastocyanin